MIVSLGNLGSYSMKWGEKNCKSLDWNTFNKDQIKVPEHFSQYSPAFLGEASLVKPLRGHK